MKSLQDKFRQIIDRGQFIPEREKICCGKNGCDPYTGHQILPHGRAQECPKFKQKRIAGYWNGNPPPKLLDPSLIQTKSLRSIREFYPQLFTRSLILLGGPGVGKTFAVESLLLECDWNNVQFYHCRHIPVP
jgi:predicted NACHT family NTPase